jgi:hypothetical protein
MEAIKMNLFDVPKSAIGLAHEINQGARDLVSVSCRTLLSAVLPRRSTRREEFRTSFWEVRRLLRTAIGEDRASIERDLRAFFGSISNRSDEIQRALIVWIDLIEVLVQRAEARHGATPGRGQLKATEVKEAIHYLIRDQHLALPGIPKLLEQVVIDTLVDWTVDGVVLLANRYGLWIDASKPQRGTRRFFSRVRQWLRQIWMLMFIFVAWLVAKISEQRATLSPDIKEYIDAVRQEGLIIKGPQFFKGVTDLLVWVGAHRTVLLSFLEIVFTAVQEAEGYLNLTGPEKKAYVRDLVLAVLDELGFEQRVGLFSGLIESTVESTIEASVHIFNKRGAFSHRSKLATL